MKKNIYLPGQAVNCKCITTLDSFFSGIDTEMSLSIQNGFSVTLIKAITIPARFKSRPFSLGQ